MSWIDPAAAPASPPAARPVDLDEAGDAVPGHAGAVVDDRLAATDQPVEQSRLADVRPADDRHRRGQRHGGPVAVVVVGLFELAPEDPPLVAVPLELVLDPVALVELLADHRVAAGGQDLDVPDLDRGDVGVDPAPGAHVLHLEAVEASAPGPGPAWPGRRTRFLITSRSFSAAYAASASVSPVRYASAIFGRYSSRNAAISSRSASCSCGDGLQTGGQVTRAGRATAGREATARRPSPAARRGRSGIAARCFGHGLESTPSGPGRRSAARFAPGSATCRRRPLGRRGAPRPVGRRSRPRWRSETPVSRTSIGSASWKTLPLSAPDQPVGRRLEDVVVVLQHADRHQAVDVEVVELDEQPERLDAGDPAG